MHGEVTARDVDVFDRESRFIDEVLAPTARRDSRNCAWCSSTSPRRARREFVQSARDGVAATITPQHLLHNRNAIFEGGIRPHYYCLPILKTEPDRAALLAAATSGNPRFFLGTDSAPHAQHTKENACGCAGMFSAHAGIELYAEAFESVGKLDKLEGFASDFGADFYGCRAMRNASRSRSANGVRPLTIRLGDAKTRADARGRTDRLAAGGVMDEFCRRPAAEPAATDGAPRPAADEPALPRSSCPWSSTSRPAASTAPPTRCSKSPRS